MNSILKITIFFVINLHEVCLLETFFLYPLTGQHSLKRDAGKF